MFEVNKEDILDTKKVSLLRTRLLATGAGAMGMGFAQDLNLASSKLKFDKWAEEVELIAEEVSLTKRQKGKLKELANHFRYAGNRCLRIGRTDTARLRNAYGHHHYHAAYDVVRHRTRRIILSREDYEKAYNFMKENRKLFNKSHYDYYVQEFGKAAMYEHSV